MEDELGLLPQDVRDTAIDMMRAGAASGRVTLAEFEAAVEVVLNAKREGVVAEMVRRIAPPARITPHERQLTEPLVIATTGMFADIRLKGRWQVPRQLTVRTGPSRMTIDLSDAEFDDWIVEITAHADLGDITVIVPRGVRVQLTGTSTAPYSSLDPPILGFPVVKLSATIGFGKLRLRHPRESRRAKRERKALNA